MILLFCLLLLAINVYCQIEVFDTPKETTYLKVFEGDTVIEYKHYRLYVEGNQYVLENHLGAEFNFNQKHNTKDALLLSFGHCSLKDDELLMVDSLNGYKMKAVYVNKDNLQFVQGFDCTKGKVFSLCHDCNEPYISFPFSELNQKFFDRESYREQKDAKQLKLGYYHSSFKKFCLMENGRYFYYNQFPKDTISKGEWKQDGNLLIFKDDGLNEPFFACIEDRRWHLYGQTMPGAASKDLFFDDNYLYAGYDEDGPSEADLAKPWIGEHFINAQFGTDYDGNAVYEVYFYENEYSIHQVQYFGDVIPVSTISYGSYYKEDFKLYLSDSLLGYRMTFELCADTSKITMLQGYCPWSNKEFEFEDKTWHRPEYAYFFDFEEITYPNKDYQKQQPLVSDLSGIYHFNNHGFTYDLTITDDLRFVYKAMGIVYLQGKVERDGNLLLFKDDCIQEPFYVLVDKDGLVAYLPGLFGKAKSTKEK